MAICFNERIEAEKTRHSNNELAYYTHLIGAEEKRECFNFKLISSIKFTSEWDFKRTFLRCLAATECAVWDVNWYVNQIHYLLLCQDLPRFTRLFASNCINSKKHIALIRFALFIQMTRFDGKISVQRNELKWKFAQLNIQLPSIQITFILFIVYLLNVRSFCHFFLHSFSFWYVIIILVNKIKQVEINTKKISERASPRKNRHRRPWLQSFFDFVI